MVNKQHKKWRVKNQPLEDTIKKTIGVIQKPTYGYGYMAYSDQPTHHNNVRNL